MADGAVANVSSATFAASELPRVPAEQTKGTVSGQLKQDLTGARLLRFSAIAIPLYSAQAPLILLLPAIYSSETGLSMTTIGLVLLFARIWDAALGPLIGAL